jgi:UDP-GlcNAc3NAcA epimerase
VEQDDIAMRIVTVLGARPQFVKASVVSAALKRQGVVDEYIVHTGQHYDSNMSGVFFGELRLPAPNRHLAVGSGSHGVQTARMLEGIEAVLQAERPEMVLVYGDTNSTLAGALAAAKLTIPVAHVEAGLRSFNRKMPEETNRVLTDHMSALLFVPTEGAVENLSREGVRPNTVFKVGDVMFDASLAYGALSDQKSRIREQLGLSSKTYALATVHRAENTDDPVRMSNIFGALQRVGLELPVILPLHPRTRRLLDDGTLAVIGKSRIRVIDPVGYLDMLQLEKHASIVLTDSGGVQKEAYFFAVPCVTLRDETEWIELLDIGWNTLWPPGSAPDSIMTILDAYRTSPPSQRPAIYGTGVSAAAIADILASMAGS